MAEREQTAFPFASSEPAAGKARGRARPARRAEAPRLNLPEQGLQLGVPDEAARQRLEDLIAAHLRTGRLALAVTDNRYTMISVRRISKEKRYEVRLHHMFADADPVISFALKADREGPLTMVWSDNKGGVYKQSAAIAFTCASSRTSAFTIIERPPLARTSSDTARAASSERR